MIVVKSRQSYTQFTAMQKKKQRFKNDLLSLSKTEKELNHRLERPIVSQEDTGLGWSHLIMKQTSKTKNSLDRLDQIVLYMEGKKNKVTSESSVQ